MSQISLENATRELPLVAILRGVLPSEVIAVADVLMEEGFRVIEVPLNSPEPYESIKKLAQHCAGKALIGAGTVLSTEHVDKVAAAGGTLIISPNTNADVISYSKQKGLVSMPGFFTPSDAFTAIHAGADALKLFPAGVLGSAAIKAYSAVLPDISVYAVGGVEADQFAEYHAAGTAGFGLGSGLYKAGMTLSQVRENARAYVSAYRALDRKLER